MYQRILVPIDGSGTSNRALDAALGLARTFNGRVRLAHVLSDSAYLAGYDPLGGAGGVMVEAVRKASDQILADGMKAAAAAGVEAESVLLDKAGERLGETIATATKLWNADLVVVGTWTDGLFFFGQRPGRGGRMKDKLPAMRGKKAATFITFALDPRRALDKLSDIVRATGADVIGGMAIRRDDLEGGAAELADRLLAAADVTA